MIVIGVAAGLAGLAAAGVLWLRRRYLVITVTGASMQPTYQPDERVLVRRTRSASSVRSGQVIVFTGSPDELREAARVPRPAAETSWSAVTAPSPGREGSMIKRVRAVPGDPVPRDGAPALRDLLDATVPMGHLVVVGDNAADSFDSRHYGYLAAERLVGVVVRRLTGPPAR